MDSVKEEDQSFADLMDACSGHFKRPRTEEEDWSSDRPRTRPGLRKHSRSLGLGSAGDSSLLVMLAKLTLRQEDQLNQLNLDRTFLFFIQAQGFDPTPTPSAFQGFPWAKGERPGYQTTPAIDVSGSVRRAGQSGLKILDRFKRPRTVCGPPLETGADTFKRVELPPLGHHEKTLKPSSKEPISSEEASKMIQRIHQLGGQQDLIHRFSALKPLQADQLVKQTNVVIP